MPKNDRFKMLIVASTYIFQPTFNQKYDNYLVTKTESVINKCTFLRRKTKGETRKKMVTQTRRVEGTS